MAILYHRLSLCQRIIKLTQKNYWLLILIMLNSLALISELLTIDHGKYLVQVTLKQEGIILGTGLAAAQSIEEAEDRARERALGVLDLINNKFSQETKLSPPVTSKSEKWEESAAKLTEMTGKQEDVTGEKRESGITLPQTKVTGIPFTPQITGEVETPKRSLTEIPQKTTKSSQSTSIPSLFEQKSSSSLELEQPVPKKEETTKSEPSLFTEAEFSLTPPPLEFGNSSEDSQGKEKKTESEIKTKPKIEIPVDFSDIIAKIDLEMNRLGWTQEQGKQYLLQTYGKKSRHLLSDEELMEFVRYLESANNEQ